ncbi:arsenical pump-driving ATPase [Chlorobium sp. BLA1]|uniref:arsenical pump-driving ATPase n=1 Tax=Candidatus Chlorobium masyuteum TaxID=2716876 RepID=UPI0014201002|nr:arsenical pump-driving ATPase [Candidatus Chlorobium masyuteum]NHQ60728.1 arsenical pump-driving ATPase [Candidatus Chlorobium masyuteum]
MKFLDHPPRFLLFTGKGGVGKTSIACASAIKLAESGQRVLLVSTDPASNVGQVFGITIGNRVTPVTAVANLYALEIDPQASAAEYRERIIGPVRGLLPESVLNTIDEQLSGACTTEIAAFDEFTSLLTDRALSLDYDHIVFDTAPTGHTIRMLQLPGAWSGFLEEAKGDASCLGPLAGLAKQRTQYKEAVDALADPLRTRMVLVSRAQQAAIGEVARTCDELSAIGISQHYLVLNGILPEGEAAKDELANAIVMREQAALSAMPERLKALPTDQIALKPFNMVGLVALCNLFNEPLVQLQDSAKEHATFTAPPLSVLVDKIADDGHGLIMFMGKGGVGKTTLAAALAVELAHRGLAVHLSTSDPAAHLIETVTGPLENLEVSRIDPKIEIERYRREVLDSKGKGLDSEGRAMLEEDLRSPCTEEIAVFKAFSRIIGEADKKFVVMDTAPTGHTLLLLDATGAYHREFTRQAGHSKEQNITPMMQMQDRNQTKVLIVTLAETTPVLEAANLQEDLRRASIEPWAWIINNSVAAAVTHSPLLRERAEKELTEIEAVAQQHAQRYAVVPLLTKEPVGEERLRALTRSESRTLAE